MWEHDGFPLGSILIQFDTDKEHVLYEFQSFLFIFLFQISFLPPMSSPKANVKIQTTHRVYCGPAQDLGLAANNTQACVLGPECNQVCSMF